MALSYSNKPKQASKPLSFPAFNTSCVWTMLPRILPACQDCVSFPRLCLKMTVFPQPSTVNRWKSSDCSACSSQTLSLSYNSASLSETMMLLFSHLVNFTFLYTEINHNELIQLVYLSHAWVTFWVNIIEASTIVLVSLHSRYPRKSAKEPQTVIEGGVQNQPRDDDVLTIICRVRPSTSQHS